MNWRDEKKMLSRLLKTDAKLSDLRNMKKLNDKKYEEYCSKRNNKVSYNVILKELGIRRLK